MRTLLVVQALRILEDAAIFILKTKEKKRSQLSTLKKMLEFTAFLATSPV